VSRPLRIAVLTHSTNPRGGVVHAVELGDALTRLGQEATVFAPDPSGAGFFRPTLCATKGIAAAPVGKAVRAMVETRVAEYVRYFEHAENRRFDVWHTQDGISANALATLKERRLIHGFARTVHHVDTFDDAELGTLQTRAIVSADRLFVVSHLWQDWLKRTLGREATFVGNGVDTQRYSPRADATDDELRERLGLPADASIFLAVGGVEERKNTIRILQAFQSLHLQYPSVRLVIAGGASILDHGEYQARFAGVLKHCGASAGAVIRTGPVRQKLMPALYRAATALVFPSVKEGFGLVVLEAMASGVPVIASRVAPFTEYLGEGDVLWCDPADTASIAAAMEQALDEKNREPLRQRGLQVVDRHAWSNVAQRHLAAYDALREPQHA
jgi:glycosyltransferase-like protein